MNDSDGATAVGKDARVPHATQRIALISDHASPLALLGGVDSGGQNVYVANLARQIGRLGRTVDVFTRRDNPLQRVVVNWAPNVRVIHLDAGPARFIAKEAMLPYMDEFADALLAFAARDRRHYDVLHSNFFMSGFAARRVAARCSAPHVITFHALGAVRRLAQGSADHFPSQRIDIERELMREADRVIAECPQDRLDMLQHYAADPSRIDVVPCGFDPKELYPQDRTAARRLLGWHPNAFTVLQLGRLVPRKGIDNVIRGIHCLRDVHGVPATLYIVGGNAEDPNPMATPEIGRLTALAAELGVDDCVKFVGRRGRDRLRTLYSAADVFVTTPWYEPFGITPVEAMACGTPVIGSAVGGIAHTVRDGVTGLLVPPEDPAALAGSLAALAEDPPLRLKLGRAARVRAQQFTWARVAGGVVLSYAAACANRARPGRELAARAVQGV